MARSSSGSSEPTKKPKVKKRRWYHQVWDVFQMTRKADPTVPWIMLGILVVSAGVGFGVGAIFRQGPYGLFIGIPLGILLSTIFLSRRAERAAYSSLEGQPGAVSAALGTIRRGWNIEEQPVAIDPRTQDLVFRAVGRPGVVLISEGPSHRAKRLLDAERRKVTRVVPNVTIHLLQVGDDEGQIPLAKITKKVQKLKNALTKAEVAEVSKRLRALSQTRMPIPKGVDPLRARPDRKGMRGR